MATAELDRVLEQARTIAIAQASLMSDVLFDNVLHIMRSITTSKKAPLWVQHAEAGLRQNQLAAQQGRSDLTQQMSYASPNLSDGRKRLQKVREQIFETMAYATGSEGEGCCGIESAYDRPREAEPGFYDAPPPAYPYASQGSTTILQSDRLHEP